ncbi:MAG: type II secretion system protein GspE [Planctomycetes bacterium]|nr:type II secretion system protein GspE [Planctomycetota bacterium]
MSNSTSSQAPTLGQILISQGVVTKAQLDNAINHQKRTKMRLGATLVAANSCSDEDIAGALARQLNLAIARIDPEEVDRDALAQLSEDYCRNHSCLPLRSDMNVLRLAVDDPFDIETSEEVQRRIARAVVVEVSTRKEIIATLDAIGDHTDRIEAMIEEAKQRATTDGLGETALLSAGEIVEPFIAQGVRRGSADIHVEPEDDLLRVRYRIDGVLQPGTMVPKELSDAVIAKIKLLSKLDIAERRVPQDGRASLVIDGREYHLRVSLLPTVTGECCTMRILDSSRALLPEEAMGLRPPIRDFLRGIIKRPHGLFLVTGPTGSGKSTTLHCMLSKVNALELKVLTIEDPVEYRLPLIRQVQVHTEIGMTFAAGLRSALRQDPDIILVGEIRDQETASIAVKASMTGHLVLSTLHTNSAVGAITRLIDIGLDPFMVASTLCGVLAQRLIRANCKRCLESYVPDEKELSRFHAEVRPLVTELTRGTGCKVCSDTGLAGRVAVHEGLALTPSLKRVVLKGATEEEITLAAVEEGFIPLHIDGEYKVADGVSTLDEVDRVALDR